MAIMNSGGGGAGSSHDKARTENMGAEGSRACNIM